MSKNLVLCLTVFLVVTLLYQTSEVAASKARHHHVFLSMKASLPKVEKRLADWQRIATLEHKKLKFSKHPKISKWRKQLDAVSSKRGLLLLKQVNILINGDVKYISDYKHWGKDFWEGPVETLEEGGDCEDYALLKATTLSFLGWSPNRMHLVAGVLDNGEAHMMLAVETKDGKRWLLDNRSNLLHRWPYDFWKPVYEVGGHKRSIRFIELGTNSKSKKKH